MVGVASLGYNSGSHWKPMFIGGGGFVTGISISNDGLTKVARTDSAGAYIYNSTLNRWVSITSTNNLPAGYVLGSAAVYEVRVCPSFSNRVYMMVNGFMFRSDDGAKTFNVLTGFPQVAYLTAVLSNDLYRLTGPKMIIDPNNPNRVFVSTGADGLWMTTDGGNNSGVWSRVTGVPVSLPDITSTTAEITKSTNAVTTATNVLNFASVPSGVVVGMGVTANTNASLIPAGTTVTIVGTTTVTISNTVTVPSGQSISFSPAVTLSATGTLLTFNSPPQSQNTSGVPTGVVTAGFYVFNYTNPTSIPPSTTVVSTSGNTVTISNSVTVSAGDTILFANPVGALVQFPGYTMDIDPTSSVVGGFTHGIYVHPWGSQVYQSLDGGSTWAALSGGPTTLNNLHFGQDGKLWVVSDKQDVVGSNSNLWTYSPTITTSTTPLRVTQAALGGGVTPVHKVATNPNDTSPNIRVYLLFIAGASSTNISIDNGSSWLGAFSLPIVSTAGPASILWLGGLGVPSAGDCAYDPSQPNDLWITEGVGVWRCNPPSTKVTITMTESTLGIENLVPTDVLSRPGSSPHFLVEDRGIFRKDDIGGQAFELVPTPGNFAPGWITDYAYNDDTFFAAVVGLGATHLNCYSTNSGQSWTVFGAGDGLSQPPVVGQNGCFAVSTSQNMVFVGGNNGANPQPYYTLDGGASWNLTDLPNVNGWILSIFDRSRMLVADKVNPGIFYIYRYDTLANAGMYMSTNSGVNWTKITSAIANNGGFAQCLRAVPRRTGELLYTGSQNLGATSTIYHYPGSGSTWSVLNSGLTSVYHYAFGKAAPGASDDTIFVSGTYNGVAGIWRSTDFGTNFIQIGDVNLSPQGTLQTINIMGADMNLYGRCYAGTSSGGFFYADYISG